VSLPCKIASYRELADADLDSELAARCRREVDQAVDKFRRVDRQPVSFAELRELLASHDKNFGSMPRLREAA
jgi:hypothetical protein